MEIARLVYPNMLSATRLRRNLQCNNCYLLVDSLRCQAKYYDFILCYRCYAKINKIITDFDKIDTMVRIIFFYDHGLVPDVQNIILKYIKLLL
jgi:hypothetical protein